MRFVLFSLLTLLFSCSSHEDQSDNKEHLSFIEIEIEYAEHFKIRNTESKYLLDLLDPETKNVEKTIEIDPTEDYKIISLSSTTNGMLDLLHSIDHLYGISNIDYVYSNEIQTEFAKKKIKAYGDESTNSIEKIVASGANVILYSGFGDEFPNSKQLEKLGFTIIPIYDWRETHPLGKAEWMKVIGLLTGNVEDANQLFNETQLSYEANKQLVTKDMTRPTVISGNLLNDIWYAPAGESFMAQMMKDAGATYTHSSEKGTGSLSLSMEEIIKNDMHTHYWINPGMTSLDQIDKANPHAKHLDAHENIYCYSPNMNKFWELSASQPDKMLSDLIHIFHPEIDSNYTFYFYSKIH